MKYEIDERRIRFVLDTNCLRAIATLGMYVTYNTTCEFHLYASSGDDETRIYETKTGKW